MSVKNFVRAIIQNEKREILLLKDKKFGWNFPGGKVEKDETPEEAVKREVFEETNLEVKDLKKVGENVFLFDNGPVANQRWKGHFFQIKKYSGKIEIKELEKIFCIKFVDYHSEEVNDLIQKTKYFFHNPDDYLKYLGEDQKFSKEQQQIYSADTTEAREKGFTKKSPSFVRVIIQNEKGELLVIFQKKWNCWVFPGGKIEPNETPLEAAKREVFEETNLVIEDLEIVGEQDFSNNKSLESQGRMGYLIKANKYSGKIENKEPEKATDIQFKQIDYEFAVNRLFYAIIFEID